LPLLSSNYLSFIPKEVIIISFNLSTHNSTANSSAISYANSPNFRWLSPGNKNNKISYNDCLPNNNRKIKIHWVICVLLHKQPDYAVELNANSKLNYMITHLQAKY